MYLAVRVLTGAAAVQTGAGHASYVGPSSPFTTLGTVSVTTTATGSWVYGMADSNATNTPLTVNGATTLISLDADSGNSISMASWRATSATGTPGATTLGGTWGSTTQSNIAALEILPFGAGGGSPRPILRPFRAAVQRAATI